MSKHCYHLPVITDEYLASIPPDFIPFAQTEFERFALRTLRRMDDAGKRALLDGLRNLTTKEQAHV